MNPVGNEDEVTMNIIDIIAGRIKIINISVFHTAYENNYKTSGTNDINIIHQDISKYNIYRSALLI